MSSAKDLGLKSGAFLGVSLLGNMKPVNFCMYTYRGVLHTPLNDPRRRFAPKTGRDLGVSLLGRVKRGAFWVYPGAEL